MISRLRAWLWRALDDLGDDVNDVEDEEEDGLSA